MPKLKFWQKKGFKELQKKWDEKLKASGFVDAERNGRLKQNANNAYRTQEPEVIENKRRYYELLGQGHQEEDFSDPIEKYVMARRSEGIRIKQISSELKEKKLGRRSSVSEIRKILRYYEKKWGIKKKKT